MTKNVISAITARISVTTKMVRVGALSLGMFVPNLKKLADARANRDARRSLSRLHRTAVEAAEPAIVIHR